MSEPHRVSEPCTCGTCDRCTFYEKRSKMTPIRGEGVRSCRSCSNASDRSLCRSCTERLTDCEINQRKVNSVVWGLQIMTMHGKVEISVATDEFFAGTSKKIPEYDREVLTDLGWRWEEEYECYALFV